MISSGGVDKVSNTRRLGFSSEIISFHTFCCNLLPVSEPTKYPDKLVSDGCQYEHTIIKILTTVEVHTTGELTLETNRASNISHATLLPTELRLPKSYFPAPPICQR